MQRKNLVVLVAATLIAGCLAAATSWAHPQTGPRSIGATVAGWSDSGDTIVRRVADRLADRLELTDAQRQEIRAVLSDHAGDLADGLRTVKDRRIALFEAIHDHPPAESDVRQAAADLATAQSDLAVLRAQIVIETRQVLTPEQQQQLDELRTGLAALADFVGEGLADRLAAALAG